MDRSQLAQGTALYNKLLKKDIGKDRSDTETRKNT